MRDLPPTLFFDGVYNLCSSAVQTYLRLDRRGTLHFASLQSDLAREVLPPLGVEPAKLSSLVFVRNGRAHVKSTGALLAARELGGWPRHVGALLFAFPSFLRNAVYDLIARYRYRWFGEKDECWLPTPDLRARFLDQ